MTESSWWGAEDLEGDDARLPVVEVLRLPRERGDLDLRGQDPLAGEECGNEAGLVVRGRHLRLVDEVGAVDDLEDAHIASCVHTVIAGRKNRSRTRSEARAQAFCTSCIWCGQVVEDLAHLPVLEGGARAAEGETRLLRRGPAMRVRLEVGQDLLGAIEVERDRAREEPVDDEELRGALLGHERPHGAEVRLVGGARAEQRRPVRAGSPGERPRHDEPRDHVRPLDAPPHVHEVPRVVAGGRRGRQAPHDGGALPHPGEVVVGSAAARRASRSAATWC